MQAYLPGKPGKNEVRLFSRVKTPPVSEIGKAGWELTELFINCIQSRLTPSRQ